MASNKNVGKDPHQSSAGTAVDRLQFERGYPNRLRFDELREGQSVILRTAQKFEGSTSDRLVDLPIEVYAVDELEDDIVILHYYNFQSEEIAIEHLVGKWDGGIIDEEKDEEEAIGYLLNGELSSAELNRLSSQW